MKKIFAFLLTLCMILTSFSTVSFAAEVPTIESSDVTLGDTVTVKVMYPATAKGVSNGSVELVYDNTKLAVVDMTAGSLISGLEQTNPAYSEDSVFINWAAAKVIDGTTAGFEVVTVTFDSIAAGDAEFSFRQFKVKAGLSSVTLDTSSTKTIKIASDVVTEKYTVTFKNDDQVVKSVEVEEGSAIGSENMPANPTKSGYTFDGWFDSEDSSVEINADTVVTKDITANAKFTQDSVPTKYTVTFKNDDQVVKSVEVEDGSAIGSENMPANPTKSGYTFDGWFDSEDSSVKIDADTVVTKDITANAKFTQTYVPTGVAPVITADDVTVGETVTVKVMYPVTAKGVSNGSVELAYDNTKLEVLNMTAGTLIAGIEQTNPAYSEDSVFINWAAAKVIDGTKDGFEIVTVTFKSNVAGKATFSLRQFKVKAGLSNVTVDLTNTDKTISIKDESGNVPADPEKFTVKFVEEDGTTAIGTPKTVLEGTKVGTLPTPPAVTGKTFDKWVDESDAEVTADTVVTGNMTVKATYTDNYYTVTFVEEDGTTTIGTPASIKHGDAVGSLPTAPAITGKTFDKWVDESGAEVTASTVVTKEMKVKATYKDIYYTVTFVGEDGTTTVGTPASVKHGATIGTLPTAPAVTGKTFAKWVDETDAEVTASTVVTKEMKVKATYTDNYYTVTFTGKEGAVIGEPESVKHGNKVTTVPTAPEVPGYEFVQWTVDGTAVADPADYEITKETEFKAEYRSLDPNTITDIEVVDADGKVVEAIEIPYGTAIDEIAAAIREAITVNEIKVEGKNNNVAYTTDPNEITERVDSIVIKAAGFAKTIALTYDTKDIKIEATEKVSVPFKNHEGKDDPAAIAEYVKGKLTVTVYDIYGIEIEDAEYAVSDYDKETESVTVSYEGAKDVTVAVTLKAKSTGTSAASGTVVRPSTSVPTTKPGTDKPGTEEPGTEEPGTDVPGTDKPGTEEPGTEEPGTDVPGTNAPFTDITADDWAYDAIKDLYDRGVISGDATNTVRPADGITREEVSKIILNARGIEVDADAAIDATDANTVSDWAAGYVATAIKEGILKGYDDGTIQAGKVVTRAEFAAIIVRALGATSEYTASSFSDITADDWYAADVECAKSLGIVTGYEDGSFKGDQPVTRREAFVMVQRMIKLIEALEK